MPNPLTRWKQIAADLKAEAGLNDPARLLALEQFREALISTCGEEPAVGMTFGQPVRCLEDLVEVPLTDYLGWHMKAQHASVYRWDGKSFRRLAAFGAYLPQISQHTLLPQWLLDNGLLVRSKLRLAGLTAEEAELLLEELDSLRAELVVPVVWNEHLWGFLTIGAPLAGQYDGSESLYLGLYGMNLVHCLERRRQGLPTREEARFREGQRALEETLELWAALRPRHSKLRLLILDEEPEMVRLLSRYFDQWGLEVVGTSSEEKALEDLARRRPQILLIDFSPQWRVPEQLIRSARVTVPEAVLLGTSTSRNEAVDAQVLKLGIHQIFRRPCFFARLAKGVFEAAIGASLKTEANHSAPPKKCLIVDEDEAALASRAHFEAKGFQVWSAASGEKALQLVHRVQPGLVLVDLKVPGIQGSELLHRIRKASPRSKVIVLTAGTYDSLEKAPKGIRPDAYAMKPIPLEELDQMIEGLREAPIHA